MKTKSKSDKLFYIIMGYPGSGKTYQLLQIANHFTNKNKTNIYVKGKLLLHH